MTLSVDKWKRILAISLTIIVIGSVWGFFEMTLGGFLHIIHFPQKGAVMGGLAVSFMAIFVAITGKPSLVPILGVIAASFKPFDAIIFGVPVLSAYIINPAIAIVMEALAFSAVAVVLKTAIDKRLLARASAGILAGSLGYISYAAFASIFGLGIWPTLDFTAKLQFILTNATPIAIMGAIMLVAGYYVGRASMPRLSIFKELRPKLYYSTSLALVLLCWVIPIVFQSGV
jgi:hypothetical protein